MSVKEHELWQLLKQKIKEECDRDASELEDSIWKICQYGIDMSKTIRDTFQTYTLHDEIHICNVMTKMLELLGESKSKLTKDECALLIMASCCHDIGMSVSEDEKEFLRSCPDCMKEYLDHNHRDYSVAYKGGAYENAEITDEILQHYIRANHHKRIREQLQCIEWPEMIGRFISINEFINVCQSHGEDAEDISRLNNFTPNVDLQLCAVLIRLGDILDFDATRAPDTIYRYINLAYLEGMEIEKSRLEWKKHQASRGFSLVQGEQPSLFHRAECTSIQIEQAIISYLNWVDEELNACGKLIRHMETRWRNIILPSKVNRQITSNGYLSGEYKITLDQNRVLDLLVGRELYSDPAVFVRELIQNAIDAVRTRKEMDKDLPPNWMPQINIHTWIDDDRYYWFRIEDNGIGMTDKSIQNYFLKVGHSYYNSDQFEADKIRYGVNLKYKPISRFGIGILSCFMGDPKNNRVEVTTKHFKENSVRYPAYRLSIQGINGYYYIANDNDHRRTAPEMPDFTKRGKAFISEPGTIIAVRTNLYQFGGAQSFKDIIDKYVIYPEIPIHYEGIEGTYDYKTEQEFLDNVHKLIPKPCDDIYHPIERIPISEENFQELQSKYPEIVWEEKPSISVYCFPLDYFTCNPAIKGAVVIASADGKGVWQSTGLDEKYIPKVRLSTHMHSRVDGMYYHVSVEMDIDALNELKKRVLPVIMSQLQDLNIKFDMEKDFYSKENVISSLSFQKSDDVSLEEIHVYQAVLSVYMCKFKKFDFNQFPWYQHLFSQQFWFNNGFVNISSVNTHNGIFADDSPLLPFEESFVSNTFLILRDEYCPSLNLSRNRIDNLPLEAMCSFEILVNQIQSNFGVYTERNRIITYRNNNRHTGLVTTKEYWKVFDCIPDFLSSLYFRTDNEAMTLYDIKNILQTQDKVKINYIEINKNFYAAVLMKYFDLMFELSDKKRISIFVVKRAETTLMDVLSCFPPSLFLLPISNELTAFGILGERYRCIPHYNANHSFASWLIKNQVALQSTVPGIYNQLIKQLRNGDNIIEKINLTLLQLRQIPHLGIEITEDLTMDDFIYIQDVDY